MPYVANSSDLDNKSLVGTNNAAVHIAAENSGDGDHKLGVLLDAGANIERRNYWGYTPLLHAIVRVQLLKTVQVLLDRGADTEAVDDDNGMTSLMWAMQIGSGLIVETSSSTARTRRRLILMAFPSSRSRLETQRTLSSFSTPAATLTHEATRT